PRSASGRCRACGAGGAWGRSRRVWTSDLQNNGQYDRLAAKALVDEMADRRAHRRAHELTVPRGVGVAFGERRENGLLQLLEERLVLLDVDEPARGDLGARDDHAVAVDGERHRHQAVLGEKLAVAQDHGADVADRLAVHQDATGREAAD